MWDSQEDPPNIAEVTLGNVPTGGQFLTSSESLKPRLEISRANLSFSGRENTVGVAVFPSLPYSCLRHTLKIQAMDLFAYGFAKVSNGF